jgi:hypothetical protein
MAVHPGYFHASFLIRTIDISTVCSNSDCPEHSTEDSAGLLYACPLYADGGSSHSCHQGHGHRPVHKVSTWKHRLIRRALMTAGDRGGVQLNCAGGGRCSKGETL